ncbi:hypothetical protein N8481_01780 [Akkermansiaceae bacterium]|nr:hypothetical protein [Akkermansiaceae bacterium]MDB4607851.1 hypothetical protein [bacterium]
METLYQYECCYVDGEENFGEIHHIEAKSKYNAALLLVQNHPAPFGSFVRASLSGYKDEERYEVKSLEKRLSQLQGEGVNLTAQPSTAIEKVIEAPTQQRSLPYEPPLLAVLYKILGWVILAGGIFSLRDGVIGAVTLIIASLFIFGIAQVVDLIGKIEFNTRKPQK